MHARQRAAWRVSSFGVESGPVPQQPLQFLVSDAELCFLRLIQTTAQARVLRIDDVVRRDVAGFQLRLLLHADTFTRAIAIAGAVESAQANHVSASIRAVAGAHGADVVALADFITGVVEQRVNINRCRTGHAYLRVDGPIFLHWRAEARLSARRLL